MNRIIATAAVLPRSCRTVSTTAVKRLDKPDMTAIKKKQMHFQVEDDVPVFLKGGPLDQVSRLLRSPGSKTLWRTSNFITRMSSGSSDDCQPKPGCPPQTTKTEPPPAVPEGPEPPPCRKLPPPCPPPFCTQIPDPGNPCNYCPPVCIDPDYPDLRRLKKNQCWFQQDDGLPVFLKGGAMDKFLFQTTIILTILLTAYTLFGVMTKL